MYQSLKIIFIVLFLNACTSNTIYKKPDDLIPPDKMVDLLTDIYIANAAISFPNKLDVRNLQYLPLVYKKYKIDSLRFKHSTTYYLSKIKEYKIINQKVIDRLEMLKKNSKVAADKYDSLMKIKRDSLKRGFKERKLPIKIKRIKKVKQQVNPH